MRSRSNDADVVADRYQFAQVQCFYGPREDNMNCSYDGATGELQNGAEGFGCPKRTTNSASRLCRSDQPRIRPNTLPAGALGRCSINVRARFATSLVRLRSPRFPGLFSSAHVALRCHALDSSSSISLARSLSPACVSMRTCLDVSKALTHASCARVAAALRAPVYDPHSLAAFGANAERYSGRPDASTAIVLANIERDSRIKAAIARSRPRAI